jgi:hypothetical protein
MMLLLTSCFLLVDKWLSPERSGGPLTSYLPPPTARRSSDASKRFLWELAVGS